MNNSRTVNLAHNLLPIGAHQVLSPAATAADVSALAGYALPTGSSYVLVACELNGDTVRTTADGATAPVAASTGHLWADKERRLLRSEEWALTKVISSGTAARLQVQHYRI